MLKIIKHHQNNLTPDVVDLINQHIKSDDVDTLKKTLKMGLSSGSVILLSLWHDDEVIGFSYGNVCIGLESKGHYFWLNEFFIKMSYRHQGNGKLLMNYFKQTLQENEINYIALVTKPTNEQAIAFYQKEGFYQNDYLWFDFTQ